MKKQKKVAINKKYRRVLSNKNGPEDEGDLPDFDVGDLQADQQDLFTEYGQRALDEYMAQHPRQQQLSDLPPLPDLPPQSPYQQPLFSPMVRLPQSPYQGEEPADLPPLPNVPPQSPYQQPLFSPIVHSPMIQPSPRIPPPIQIPPSSPAYINVASPALLSAPLPANKSQKPRRRRVLVHLYQMLSDVRYQNLIDWDPEHAGTFLISDEKKFEKEWNKKMNCASKSTKSLKALYRTLQLYNFMMDRPYMDNDNIVRWSQPADAIYFYQGAPESNFNSIRRNRRERCPETEARLYDLEQKCLGQAR